MRKEGTWLEMWERVQRYYERFRFINDGMPPSKEDAFTFNFQDEAFVFFVFCYHLMDWIDKDKTITLPKKVSAREYVNQNECLSVCRDIANGIKHLKQSATRTKKPRFEEEGRVSYNIKEGKLKRIGVKFWISTTKINKDAFEMATECMEKWKEFIDKYIDRADIDGGNK